MTLSTLDSKYIRKRSSQGVSQSIQIHTRTFSLNKYTRTRSLNNSRITNTIHEQTATIHDFRPFLSHSTTTTSMATRYSGSNWIGSINNIHGDLIVHVTRSSHLVLFFSDNCLLGIWEFLYTYSPTAYRVMHIVPIVRWYWFWL
jgi:hypothetical protein